MGVKDGFDDRGRRRVVVVSGGTNGMGRAFALARARAGDSVVALGSDPQKGRRLLDEAEEAGAAGRTEFLRADLSTVSGTREAVARIAAGHDTVDALILCANRQHPRHTLTEEGLERTFALYYLSRHVLGEGLGPQLLRSPSPVIVNVAGVGARAGRVHWDDLRLERRYSTVRAQLQAGRANDLLGVAHAARTGGAVPYVLYHPGFTRSGDLGPLSAPARLLLRVLARIAARPVERSVAPLHGFVDDPPRAPLTAVDRGRTLPLDLPTLDPGNADRLAEVTRALLREVDLGVPGEG
ncbi:SDR family NAD(P)-dependent oxidoreductase [Nocardiopsis sp. NPDC006938]|uniref:SDR family NAD(P)-dependent oxidoreductase n=1 Tax=Nocardiopsis sp. NPDC006938 TaxID=3364337 RepID=UPI0036C57306